MVLFCFFCVALASVCGCGAGSWSRLSSPSERERGTALASSSFSLPSPPLLPPPPCCCCCRRSATEAPVQLDKCTRLQLCHPEKQQHTHTGRKKNKKTTLPDLHPPHPDTPPSRGQTLTKLSSAPRDPLHPYLWRQIPSTPPATMVPLCPDNTNGLGFQLIPLSFKRKKKGRHQHRIGGSGRSLQWLHPLNVDTQSFNCPSRTTDRSGTRQILKKVPNYTDFQILTEQPHVIDYKNK